MKTKNITTDDTVAWLSWTVVGVGLGSWAYVILVLL